MHIILASRSPRRRELLLQMGIGPFDILVPDTPEIAPPGLSPAELVTCLSVEKAKAAAELAEPGALLIASDTMVELDGKLLGKPRDEAEAFSMLRRLAGRVHTVYTGLALYRDGLLRTACEHTDVRFRTLTDGEIRAYIATGEPMDKAGAYAIQGGAGRFVEALDGPFDNVVGFPTETVREMLEQFIQIES